MVPFLELYFQHLKIKDFNTLILFFILLRVISLLNKPYVVNKTFAREPEECLEKNNITIDFLSHAIDGFSLSSIESFCILNKRYP